MRVLDHSVSLSYYASHLRLMETQTVDTGRITNRDTNSDLAAIPVPILRLLSQP